MTGKKTHYEILGVPKTASTDDIKRRYRQLVRKYHPDVAEDKSIANIAFLQIAEAYKTLVNENRRLIYDAELSVAAERAVPEPRVAQAQSPQSRTTQARHSQSRAATISRAAEAQRLVKEAQADFAKGRLRPAMLACEEATRLDPRNVQGHMILGEIYRIQGQTDLAMARYSIVVQLDPRNAEIQARLDRLIRQSRAEAPDAPSERRTSFRLAVNLMGWPITIALLLWLHWTPSTQSAWIAGNLRMISRWDWVLIAVLLGAGFIAGVILSLTGVLKPLENCLVFSIIPKPKSGRYSTFPGGLIVAVVSLLSFYLAAFVYFIIGIVQESYSPSVLKAFLAAFVIAVAVALMRTSAAGQTLAYGANLILPSLLLGWAVGDAAKPEW